MVDKKSVQITDEVVLFVNKLCKDGVIERGSVFIDELEREIEDLLARTMAKTEQPQPAVAGAVGDVIADLRRQLAEKDAEKRAATDLFQAVIDCEADRELEAGCNGDGPVRRFADVFGIEYHHPDGDLDDEADDVDFSDEPRDRPQDNDEG